MCGPVGNERGMFDGGEGMGRALHSKGIELRPVLDDPFWTYAVNVALPSQRTA